ncbi:MAG: GPO family capsid scaffolding protein [Sphingomonas paucimobilis]
MGKKSQFFRAFVEGNTISDGRTITAEMIDEVVETFNLDSYTPRINIEHIAGFSPEPPFNGYGSIFAVKAQDDTIKIAGKDEKRRALYIQVDANDQLVELSARDQKPFPSVELTPSYAGSGKVGLIGLAFTDTPASIGTQSLKFSRTAPGSIFAVGTEAPAIEFEADQVDAKSITASVKEGVMAAFSAVFATRKEESKPPVQEPVKTPANDNDFSAIATAVGDAVADKLQPLIDSVTASDARFKAIEDQLATTEAPDNFSRPPATGGDTPGVVTDC